jgi:hypothetical protein
MLVSAGHEVRIPSDASLTGARDHVHFQYARDQRLVLVTLNPKHFRILHDEDAHHSGILAIYQDNDGRDMHYSEIVAAIANLEVAGVPIAGQFHILNAWRY